MRNIDIIKRKNYDIVVEALEDLKKLGYTLDFSILTESQCLICRATKYQLSPEDFKIDAVYRFEGDTDPGDSMVVYAISSCDNSLKDTLVNGYGIYPDKEKSCYTATTDMTELLYIVKNTFMTLNLLSCNAQRPDKRAISQCIAEIAQGVNDSLAREFTQILLEGDAVEIEMDNKNTASALRKLRKLEIDYEIIA